MRFNPLTSIIIFLAAMLAPALGAEGGHKLPLYAEELPNLMFSNSMIMTWIATAILVIFAQIASKKITTVPTGVQNFAEWVTESLYDFLGGILGDHLVKNCLLYTSPSPRDA